MEKRKRDSERMRKPVDAKRTKKIGSPPVVEPLLKSSDSMGENWAANRFPSRSPLRLASGPADDFLVQSDRDIVSDRTQ